MFGCQINQGTRVFEEGEGGKKCYMPPHWFVFAFPLSYLLGIPGLTHNKSSLKVY